MVLEMPFPNINVACDRGRLEARLHRGQVNLSPIVCDEDAIGWSRFWLTDGDHKLITQSEHSGAGCRIVLCVTVTKLMGRTFLDPINGYGVSHEEASTGLVDGAVLIVAFHAGILCASNLPVKLSLVTNLSYLVCVNWKRLLAGANPGLQNRRVAGNPVTDGFDPHSLPPFVSNELPGFRLRLRVRPRAKISLL